MRSKESRSDRDELARLLKEAGSAYDPEGVQALIEGVLAAPAEVGTSWHVLVAEPITPGLADGLKAVPAAMASSYPDGLAAEDFERLPRPERLTRLRPALAARGRSGC